MSRRLLLGLVVLVLGALLPGTASAEPERGFFVVEGKGGTTTEWVVEEGSEVFLNVPVPELTGGGSYAGVLIELIGGSGADRTGAVRVRAFSDSTRNAIGVLGSDPQLTAGRYRVTLLGQGPVRARYRLSTPDDPGVVVVPKTPLPVRFFGRAEALPLGSFGGARVDMPGGLPAGKRAIQVALRDRTSVEDFRMCATSGEACSGRLLGIAAPPSAPGSETLPAAAAGQDGPQADVLLHGATTAPRALVWSVETYHQEADDRLRAAAIVF